MNLFYYGQANLRELFHSGNHHISLPDDEAAHLKVFRMKQGDLLLVTDGMGQLAKAVVVEITNKSNILQLTEVRSYPQPQHTIHIAVAPTKNLARFEWFLEKATEIGINEITPFFGEHSERVNLRHDRLNKVLVSAMKQSLKPYLPRLNEPVTLREFLNKSSNTGNQFIAWLDKNNEQLHLKKRITVNKPATILIGPEGDFSLQEVESAKAKGFVPISLGSSRLRTETAALAACFIANLVNEPDLSGYPLTFD